MTTYNVINAGQGDCVIIKPGDKCRFYGKKLVIDLGSDDCDITKIISQTDNLHIFFSHHHRDHLGGFRFFGGRLNQIKEITVPLYQNEIILIARAILSLKGINTSSDCGEFISELKDIVRRQADIVSLTRLNDSAPILSFAYEGKNFCNHIKCLNPPLQAATYDIMDNVHHAELFDLMRELFIESFAAEMGLYIRAHTIGNGMNVDSQSYIDHFLFPNRDDREVLTPDVLSSKFNFVLGFIIDNLHLLRAFNANSNRQRMKKVYSKFLKRSHDVCTVLKTNFHDKTMLHTGDASKKVFYRLIDSGVDISADYLKIPHHGSKHNINGRIIDKISPEIAIISHDNGHFGSSPDPHPNKQTLELLKSRQIKILVTNDVVKNNVTVMCSSCGYRINELEIIS
jgi:beta-lactamase superfamily II metal-dependent hydrolase